MCGSSVRSVVMPDSPPNTLRRISDDEATSSPMPSEIIAKTVPARLVMTQPTTIAKASPPRPPISGMKGSGIGHLWRGDHIHHVDGEEAAEAIINRVTERQQAGLAEQDIVGQGEDNRDADQAERSSASRRRRRSAAMRRAPSRRPTRCRRTAVCGRPRLLAVRALEVAVIVMFRASPTDPSDGRSGSAPAAHRAGSARSGRS